ncbi:MAG: ABC transporter ATP-binding protein [Candidatus Methylacidiphilales bacterium]
MLALRCEALSYAYGKNQALRGVDLEVAMGRVFGLLGPNGGGKTTLFKLAATLTRPQLGVIEVLGRTLPMGGPEVRSRLGVVFQQPSLDKKLRVRENLKHHGRLYGMDSDRMARRSKELLETLGVADRAEDVVETLSGGLQRRVEIAKALMPGPELLLMDEPSTGLDPGVRRDLWRYLSGLKDQGTSILVTTHFLDEAERCDELAILDGGRVVAHGSPESLRRGVGGALVRVEVGAPDRVVEALKEVGKVTREGESVVVRFDTHDVGAATEAVRAAVTKVGVDLRSLSASPPCLEDVYAAATGRSWREGVE